MSENETDHLREAKMAERLGLPELATAHALIAIAERLDKILEYHERPPVIRSVPPKKWWQR